ncbi:hypothetical protein [Nonlabens agnitus]|uniref:Uncharacterized protein n=1 Tax=Nonlabens agnitus TaxID=870484 RepID=A0A2S9WQW0_9FLAO|nr:hypothetical protein [Nonlabens agnitus]PRP65877.1 hypothetical protein BST86_01620 [Nonlabens agnitus]
MKSNKTKTYILLAAVAIIWGIIIYKVVQGMKGDLPPPIESVATTAFNEVTLKKRDTFSIKDLPKDPFLGIVYKKEQPKAKFTSITTVPAGDNPYDSFPRVSYDGILKRPGTTNSIYVVKINGKQHLLKLNQEVDSVRLTKANDKTIIVRYKNRTKTISYNETPQ